MVLVNTLEGQARVRLFIKSRKLYLTSMIYKQNFVEGKSDDRRDNFDKISWWEIHPMEEGNPEKGYKLSNRGYFMGAKIITVPNRATKAIELTKDAAQAVVFYTYAANEASPTFVLTTDVVSSATRALTLTLTGQVGHYHPLAIPSDVFPEYQYYTSAENLQPLPYKIGDLIGGGIVFWVNDDGSEGRVVALEDQDNESNWSEAKELCENLELNGFSDWYAPSVSDLKFMEIHLDSAGLGDFNQEKPYWSSEVINKTHAWTFKFKDHGSSVAHHMVNLYNVRAVRAIKAE
jgi:hypothetical protein